MMNPCWCWAPYQLFCPVWETLNPTHKHSFEGWIKDHLSTKLSSYTPKFMKNRDIKTETIITNEIDMVEPVWLFRKLFQQETTTKLPSCRLINNLSGMDTSITNWLGQDKQTPPYSKQESANMATMSGWMNKQNVGLSGNSVWLSG